MPAAGLSLDIGWNEVNPDHGGGWERSLQAWTPDGRDRQAREAGRGVERTTPFTL